MSENRLPVKIQLNPFLVVFSVGIFVVRGRLPLKLVMKLPWHRTQSQGRKLEALGASLVLVARLLLVTLMMFWDGQQDFARYQLAGCQFGNEYRYLIPRL